jgi:tol-pal system protein YbgF
MRRIKTYVMTVGVALSVAPIFNYALAQQGNSATQLLLQVQDMKQEVGELRDLIERQQFQLKRLQQQVDGQSRQLELVQRPKSVVPSNGALNNSVDPSNYSNASPQSLPQHELQSQLQLEPQISGTVPQQSDESYASPYSNQAVSAAAQVSQQTTLEVVQPQAKADFYRPNTLTQEVAQTTVSAANESAYTRAASSQSSAQIAPLGPQSNSVGSTSSTYPPVIDRSFNTSTPVVPVTGAGSKQISSPTQAVIQNQAQAVIQNQAQAVIQNQAQAVIQNQPGSPQNSASQVALATEYTASSVGQKQVLQDSRAQVSRAPQSSNSAAGASVPTQVVSVPAASIAGQTQNAIDASQMSTQGAPAVPVNLQSQLNQPQVQAVLSEEDYYAQGFELLKQSKYEEAASIFQRQLLAHPRGDLADDAHYWIAEAMHVSRKLDVAKVHLKAIINDYPQSRRLPDAMLKTAYIEQSQGNQIEARILFQEVVNLHPQSDAAIAAKNQLAAVN